MILNVLFFSCVMANTPEKTRQEATKFAVVVKKRLSNQSAFDFLNLEVYTGFQTYDQADKAAVNMRDGIYKSKPHYSYDIVPDLSQNKKPA